MQPPKPIRGDLRTPGFRETVFPEAATMPADGLPPLISPSRGFDERGRRVRSCLHQGGILLSAGFEGSGDLTALLPGGRLGPGGGGVREARREACGPVARRAQRRRPCVSGRTLPGPSRSPGHPAPGWPRASCGEPPHSPWPGLVGATLCSPQEGRPVGDEGTSQAAPRVRMERVPS